MRTAAFIFSLLCIAALLGAAFLHRSLWSPVRWYLLLNALVYAALAYGTRQRLSQFWPLGFAAIGLAVFWFLFKVATSASGSASQTIVISLKIAVVSMITAYWGVWWFKQREYFGGA